MTLVRFRYVTKDRDRHGNVRFYVRRPGKPKVRLRGLPGSDEFVNAYKAALSESDASGGKAVKSFDWLCDRYYKSAYFQALEDYTQRRKRTVLNEIGNIVGSSGRRLGDAPFTELKRVHVRRLRDMKAGLPEAANFRLKQISALYAWAIKNDLATSNQPRSWRNWVEVPKASTPGRMRTWRPSRRIGKWERDRVWRWPSCFISACAARTRS